MTNEFQSEGFLKDRYICYKDDLRRGVITLLRRVRGRKPDDGTLNSRISNRRVKQLLLREKLAVADGEPSWLYTAMHRGDADPLTNYALDYIVNQVPREARILVTGCGTGITAFHLADQGFAEVVGFDLLGEAIQVANRIKDEFNYTQTSFYVDNGFKPTLRGTFDVITAMHWVFSAWAGNYGNDALPIEQAKDPEVREQLLRDLLAAYAPALKPGGTLIIELTDAVTDYRLTSDHKWRDASAGIYPVRHSPDQVDNVARAAGLTVVDRKLCVSYGHHPRTSYFLRKLQD